MMPPTSTMQDPATQAAAAGPRRRDRLAIPPIESPFLDEALDNAELPEDVIETVRKLGRDGYLIFDLDLPDFDEVTDRILADLAPRYGDERRIAEAWYWNEDVRALACTPKVLDILRLVYQRDPIPFQTLNFERGSEQPIHSDAIHFHSLPRHYMAGVWIAFEDIHPDSGPLIGHPGSHVLPDVDMQDLGVPAEPEYYGAYEEYIRDMLKARAEEPEVLLMKKGQAVLWLTNFLHGGTAIRGPDRTRHSMVTHYYFEGCQYYFPMQSDLSAGKITRREVIDLRDGSFVQHMHDGKPVDLGDLSKVCTYPRPLPDWVR
jgi:hypothetical protein